MSPIGCPIRARHSFLSRRKMPDDKFRSNLMTNRRSSGEMKMTTSGQMEFLSEILEWKPIPPDTLVYFRERLRHRLYVAILDAFAPRVKERSLKQADLAIRIHRKRAQIARWLSTQNNLTLDSISDLMVGLGMDFDAFPFTPIEKTITAGNHQVSSKKADSGNALKKALDNKLERTSARGDRDIKRVIHYR